MYVQEEGIVAKQLDSAWKADDKSGTWLKLKPDYFHMQEVWTKMQHQAAHALLPEDPALASRQQENLSCVSYSDCCRMLPFIHSCQHESTLVAYASDRVDAVSG